jgi:glycosyltransferase involved in cell wall biosynthesis
MQNVQMCGFVAGEAKWDALRSALAVVVPSRCYELGPLSMVESLVAGTPVVAPDLAHFPGAINDRQTGLLFRAGDADDLQSKLAWLADDVDRAVAMGRLAREAAESRYTADAHYRGLLHIYERVVA